MYEIRATVPVDQSQEVPRLALEAGITEAVIDPMESSITLREVRAIVSDVPIAHLTHPMIEPAADVIEDLWQLSTPIRKYGDVLFGPFGDVI
jgi:hypothetical protein